jgi:hypothetical protein
MKFEKEKDSPPRITIKDIEYGECYSHEESEVRIFMRAYKPYIGDLNEELCVSLHTGCVYDVSDLNKVVNRKNIKGVETSK